MAEPLEVSMSLSNQKLQFTGALRSLPPITTDYIPPLGDGQGYTPLELLLMSLASCSGGTVASLLRKMRKNVTGLSINAKGFRRDEHPTSFHTITLEFIITANDTTEAELEKAIQLSEEKYCPVWTMLKNNVEIVTKYQIIVV